MMGWHSILSLLVDFSCLCYLLLPAVSSTAAYSLLLLCSYLIAAYFELLLCPDLGAQYPSNYFFHCCFSEDVAGQDAGWRVPDCSQPWARGLPVPVGEPPDTQWFLSKGTEEDGGRPS